MNHDARLSIFMIHQATIISMDSQPLEDIESMPKSIGGFDLGVRP